MADRIDLSDEKLAIDGGESISPEQVGKAQEGYEPEPEPGAKTEEVKAEEKPEPSGDEPKKIDEDAPKDGDVAERKPPKSMPYGKWNEERRARKEAESEVARLRAQLESAVKQDTGKAPTATQKEDINKLLAEDPARAIEIISERKAQEKLDAYKGEQAKEREAEQITFHANETYQLMLKRPESKDPDFEQVMLYLISQNPECKYMPPEKKAKFLMGEYKELRQSEVVDESKKVVAAKVQEGNRAAKLAVAQPGAGGAVGGKRTFKTSEIPGLLALAEKNPKEYNDLSEELDLAEQEGRIIRG